MMRAGPENAVAAKVKLQEGHVKNQKSCSHLIIRCFLCLLAPVAIAFLVLFRY